MLKSITVITLAGLLAGGPQPATEGHAFQGSVSMVCITPAGVLFDSLRGRKWREAPAWHGLASDKNMVQLWTAGNSWTITLQTTDLPDTACIIWSGDTNEFLKAIRGEPL